MSAARRSSSSSSPRRYSHSSTQDRHSHSRCCSTAKGHGIGIIYLLSAKLLIFVLLKKSTRLREKKEREQPPVGRLSLCRFYAISCYALRFFVIEHALAPEGQPHAEARERVRPGVNRIRVRKTANRIRAAARPQRDTASPC